MSAPSLLPAALTDPSAAVAVPAPAPGAGNWSGAASATWADGAVHLTYRVRRPLTEGRGVTTVVARSEDGVRFTTVAEVHRDAFGAESFERPVVVAVPGGGWRLYLSCATPGSKHWWIEALDAPTVEQLPAGRRTVVLAGDDRVAVKDPVVVVDDGRWHAWVCEHPLDVPGHEDRMSTAYYSSTDGLVWRRHGPVLAPRDGSWDARGARVTAVLSLAPLVVLYDGRPRAEDNWHETTGVALGTDPALGPASPLRATDDEPLRSPDSDGALRYVSAVPLPDGSVRYYAERARPDGAHDLVTVLAPAAG
ncbi:hypothetical protein INN71_09850 [Nocardioides sp. ChNu-153]|uniref:hypothetical protein n=1 Tax=unclassified Nocardioides TaxID=2615069 RepID=UPI002405B0FD|nr:MULTISPECIES: hypothetical protein [unclassified Nocardioides]MDF9715710.1 hypothetical protein [Nocardioides sp. ChNu-99]MDN7121693.1 hypothetical protein [Nocardioides sp. ChNu-153]